jgi:pimeloyl-ACP methyl ester carboxylesterase
MSTAPSGLTVRERPPTSLDDAAPAGLPYLLVHGSMDRSASFARLEKRLPEATIITYDRRGYAGSAGRKVSESFADQVDDLLEVVDGRPVVALGHSFGGGVVLAVAQRHPELIAAAVIWEPPMPWLEWWPRHTAAGAAPTDERLPGDVAESFMRRMVGERIWERLPAATRAARRAEGQALVAEMRALQGPIPWDPTLVTVPVLVGAGGESTDYQRRSAVELAAALPAGELVTVAEARHGVHLSHAAELAGLLRRAARLAGAPSPPLGKAPAAAASSSRTDAAREELL